METVQKQFLKRISYS